MITFTYIPDPLIRCNYEAVYYPSDDSYLIIDHFRNNIDDNYFDGIQLENIEKILDLGTGTGIIAIFLQMIKSQNHKFNPQIFASDILEESIKCAKNNEQLNNKNGQIQFLLSDLFKSFPENLKSTFNIIIFNPPYLPSSEISNVKKVKEKKDLGWDGGLLGFELIIRFLHDAKYFLNLEKEHYVYFISSSRTPLDALNKEIRDLGYYYEVLVRKHFFFEDIILNRLYYTKI
ncbi:MAG: HemK2/MTQ2 family protein methyltransferase [Promethearchaeota archaeon]